MGRVLILSHPPTDGWDRDLSRFLQQAFLRNGAGPVECVPLDYVTGAYVPPFRTAEDRNQALSRLRATLTRYADATPGAPPSVHPGFSYWAERPELATLCQELGLNAFLPSARLLNLFNTRLNLLMEAERLGIPNLLIHPEPFSSLREIDQWVEKGGGRFPLVLKSSRTVAGSDHFVVQDREQMHAKLPLWMEQLRWNTGEIILFAERYLEGARRIEVPFVRLHDGRMEIFPAIDSSLQSRNRRLIEICPPPGLDERTEALLRSWTREFVESHSYVGVGSLEYLSDGERAFLIGGDARLNSTFRLWERVAGTDAVAWQIAAFSPEAPNKLPSVKPKRAWGVGLAIRLYAEDPVLSLPRPGKIVEASSKTHWIFPQAEAELSLGVGVGQSVPDTGSGRLGILWVGASDRTQAMRVARGAVEELWIAGSLQTNERFLAEILTHPWVKEGVFHAGFIDEDFVPQIRPPSEWLPYFASVGQALAAEAERWAVGDQWVKPLSETRPFWKEPPRRFDEGGLPGLTGTVILGNSRQARVCAYPLSATQWLVRIGEWTLTVRRAQAPRPGRVKRAPKLHSVVSGRVHALLYREGATVPAHEPLAVVESLGTLVPHALPIDVKVSRWLTFAESRVRQGEELALLEELQGLPEPSSLG